MCIIYFIWIDNTFCICRFSITKTYLYNFDPLKPHFYIVKLGFTGVYIIFLITAQNIDCGYSLEPPHRGCSNEYPQSMFRAEIWKLSEFFIWIFSFFGDKIFCIFEYACFRNAIHICLFYSSLRLYVIIVNKPRVRRCDMDFKRKQTKKQKKKKKKQQKKNRKKNNKH